MMRLRRLQREMQRHLLGEDSLIAGEIIDAPPLAVADRLGIYRNAYQVRLIEALSDTFPVLRKLLGDEVFDSLGRAFVAENPSTHRSIRWYGRELPDFVGQTQPYSEQPIFEEIAWLEWILAEVFDAADALPVQRTALAAIDPAAWGALRFEFHPAMHRLHLSWNTVAVWQAMSRDESPPQPQVSERSVPWLLWRRDLQNYFRSMSDIEAVALDAALSHCDFGEICENLAALLPDDEIPPAAAGFLSAWVDSGIIVRII